MLKISEIDKLFPKSSFMADTQKFSDSLKEDQQSEAKNDE